MALGADAVDGHLDRGVHQLSQEYEEKRANHQRALDTVFPQPEGKRSHDQEYEHFLTNGNLTAERIAKPSQGMLGRPQ